MEKQEKILQEMKEYEKYRETLEKSVEIGVKKAKDFGFQLLQAGPVDFILPQEIKDEYNIKLKEDVKEAMKERDDIYNSNPSISGVDKFYNGIVESISNPLELGANIGLSMATGGASIPVQIASQIPLDVAQSVAETYRYEDRMPTTKELAFTVGTSIAPDMLSIGFSKFLRNSRVSMNSSVAGGDINIDVKQKIADFEEVGKYAGAKAEQIFTDYPQNRNSIDPYRTKIIPAVEPQLKVMSEALGKNLEDVKLSIDSRIVAEASQKPTVLQRTITSDKIVVDELNSLKNDLKSSKIKVEGTKSIKGNDYQQISRIYNNKSGFLDEFSTAVMPTVQDFSKRYEAELMRGEKSPKLNVGYGQVETAIKNLNANYETQKMKIKNEYTQILGQKPVDFIKEIGIDEKNISQNWIQGNPMGNFENANHRNFLQSAFDDSVELDQMRMKVDLENVSDFENFTNSYKNILNDEMDGISNYYFNTLNTIKNAEGTDKKLLLDLLKKDDSQYFDLINNLENIDKFTNDEFADIFGASKKKTEKLLNELKENGMLESLMDSYTTNKPVRFDSVEHAKKSFYDKVTANRKKLAVESIKINQVLKKNEMLGFGNQFFENKPSLKGEYKIKSGMESAYNDLVDKYFDLGMKDIEGMDRGQVVYEFFKDLGDTRQSAQFKGEYKTIGELRKYFEDSNSMTSFFSEQTDFLKSNAEMVRDIYDKNSVDIARFLSYDAVSPFAIKNKVNFKLKGKIAEILPKVMNTGEGKAVNQIKEKITTMIDNTMNLNPAGTFQKGFDTTMGVVRRGILGWSGMSELTGQNYFFAMSKSMKYGGFEVLKNEASYQFARAYNRVKGQVGPNPWGKYQIAQAVKDYDFNYIAGDRTIINKYDNLSMGIQGASSNQWLKFGEGFSTRILHNMKENFNGLENELKDLLRINGITENNYQSFREFSKNHIDSNDLIVNVGKLADNLTDTNSNALRNVYYQLSDYVGRAEGNGILQKQNKDNFMKMYTLFRSFSRQMNEDVVRRVLTYTNAEGIQKSRLSSSYFKPASKGGYGYDKVARDSAMFAVGTGLAIAGAQTYEYSKEIIYSARKFSSKMALIGTKTSALLNEIPEESQNYLLTLVNKTGVNPWEELKASDMSTSVYKAIMKVYEGFTNEEKKTLGTNVEEGSQAIFELLMTYVVSSKALNWGKAIHSEFTGEDKNPYDLTKAELKEFEHKKRMLDNKRGIFISNSIADTIEEKTNTYDTIDDKGKELFNTLADNLKIPDSEKDRYKSEFAMAYATTKTKDELANALDDTYGISSKEAKEIIEGVKIEMDYQDKYFAMLNYFSEDKISRDQFDKIFTGVKKEDMLKQSRKYIKNVDFNKFRKFYNNKENVEDAMFYQKTK